MTTSNLTDTTTNQVLYCEQDGLGCAAKFYKTNNNANCVEIHSISSNQSALWVDVSSGLGYCMVASCNTSYPAVYGQGFGGGIGVSGYSTASASYGVYGLSSGIYGTGVEGQCSGASGFGVYGAGGTFSGYFTGAVLVGGWLTKSGGGFKIDHPSDPENKYLNHCFVESPEMKNVYDGVVVLNADGGTTVTMPSYFEAANSDFRYQLTAIGSPMPNLCIASEINGNQFTISGGHAGAKVSWQVTGVRADKWALANYPGVEIDKKGDEKGLFMHPELHGHDFTKNINKKIREPVVHEVPDFIKKP